MTINQFLFKNRSYTPLPFLAVMVIFAHPTIISMIAGFLIAALGEFTRASGVFYVGSETRVTGEVGASKLVTSGPFSRVRNPLYLGNIMLYIGIGVMSMALFPWLQIAALIWFVFQYSMIIADEERFLLDKFGDEFREYLKKVPRFFPRITSPYKSANPTRIDWSSGWRSERRTLQAFGICTVLIVVIWMLQWHHIL
jgi:protein-S-isoprenylcysteine O-methyltransferase Ste14